MTPEALLALVFGRLETQRAAKAIYAERLAPDFALHEFLDLRENGLSRIFAWLLDPRGSHAQGATFLLAFVAWLGLSEEWREIAGGAKVWTEYPCASAMGGGYIDVLVSGGGRLLAIENKPSAVDQPWQVARYLDDLAASRRSAHALLYLSGDGEAPSDRSIEPARAEREMEAGTLLVRGYPALLDWLAECRAHCRAPNVEFLVETLEAYVRRRFMGMGDVGESDDLAASVCGSSERLEAALAVLEAEPAIRRRILDRLVSRVREEAEARDGWRVIRDDLGPERHGGLLVALGPRSSIGFGFQFDRPGYGWLFYGVASENASSLPPGVKAAMKAFIGTQSGTDYWPVWKAAGADGRHFPLSRGADREFWLMADDGRLSAMLISYVSAAEDVLRDAGLLDAVRDR